MCLGHTNKVTFFPGISLVDLRDAYGSGIRYFDVERVSCNRFPLVQDLDPIRADHVWLVFDPVDAVLRSGNIVGDSTAIRT